MVAVKGNIEYSINASEKEAYIKNGFDIYENGKKIADGEHKTVSYAEYKKVKNALEELKKTQFNKEEVDKLLDTLKAKDEELTEVGTKLEAKEKEFAEVKEQLKAKDEELTEVGTKLEAKEKEFAEVKEQLKAKDEEIKKLKK